MKKKLLIISILTIIVLIPISAMIKVKYMRKQLEEERLSYTLCNRETFTDQLESIANEKNI